MTFNIPMTSRLVYPVRVGEHSNSAFGLAMALDYTRFVSEDAISGWDWMDGWDWLSLGGVELQMYTSPGQAPWRIILAPWRQPSSATRPTSMVTTTPV